LQRNSIGVDSGAAADRSQRAGSGKHLFGFRNSKFDVHPQWNSLHIPSLLWLGDRNRRTISFGAVGMYREHLGRLFGTLKRALRTDQRLTIGEFSELLQLAEAIIDYAQMIQNHEVWSGPTPLYTLVEIPEMAGRFRETLRAIKGALLLLKNMGRATPVKSRTWRVKLPGAPRRPRGRRSRSASLRFHTLGNDR